jgi:hypothetical protein
MLLLDALYDLVIEFKNCIFYLDTNIEFDISRVSIDWW